MNAQAYMDSVREIPVSEKLQYQLAYGWLNPNRLPLALVSLGDEEMPIIKVPAYTENNLFDLRLRYQVPVITIGGRVFRGNENVTDIILPSTISRIGTGAFSGCRNLRNITIPRNVKQIDKGTFAGCDSLQNIYYEGTPEDWAKISIVHMKHEVEFGNLYSGTPVQQIVEERMVYIPGNDALYHSTIHFHCTMEPKRNNSSFRLRVGTQDVTEFFRLNP